MKMRSFIIEILAVGIIVLSSFSTVNCKVSSDNDWDECGIPIYLIWDPDNMSKLYFSVDDKNWILYTGQYLIYPLDDGEYEFCYYYIDHEGHISDENGPFEFLCDCTPPSINLFVEKQGFNNWLFTADVSDETSGVDKVGFYVDDEYVGEVTNAPYVFQRNRIGSHSVYAIACDNAGNYEQSEIIDSIILKNQQLSHPLLSWFLQHFPNMFLVLGYISFL